MSILDTATGIGMSILSTLGIVDDSIVYDSTTCVGKVSTELAVNSFGEKMSNPLDSIKTKQNYKVAVTLFRPLQRRDISSGKTVSLFPGSFSVKNQYGFTVIDSNECIDPFVAYIVYPFHLYSCSLELGQNETVIIKKIRSFGISKKFVGQCPKHSLFSQKSVDK